MFERVKKGFTLVELLVVMAILAILTTVSTVGYFSFIEKAKISNDNTFASELNTLIQTMKVEDEEITYEDLCKMYLEQTGEDISTLKPQSAEYGYHFWFDQNNEEVIVARSEDLINESTIIFYNQSNSNLRELIIDNYIFLDGQGSDLADVISTYDSVNGKEAYLSLQTLLLDGADDKFDATLINKIDGIIDQTAFVTNEGSFRASILDETIYVKVAKNLESTCPSLFVYNGESLVESFIESSNPIACFDGVITLPETIKEIGTNSLFFESESLKIVLPNDLDTSNTLFSHFTNVNVVINDVEYVYVEESNSYESIENSEIVLETDESNLEITNFDVYFNDELVGNNYFSSLDINKEYLVSIKNVIGIPGGNIDQSNLVVEVISGEEICYSDNNVIVFEKYGTSIIKVYTNYNPDVYKEITIQMNGVTYFTSKINSSLLDGNSEETPFVIEKKEGVESFELSLETTWFVNKIEDVNLLDVSIESSLTYVANSNISYNFNMPEVGNYQITIKLNNHGLEKTIYISVIPEIEHYFDFNLENRDKYMYRFGNKNVFVPSEFVIATDELINANLELSDLVFEYNFYSVDEGDSKINLLDASGEKFYVTYSDTSRTSYKFIGEGVVEIEYISYLDGVEVDRNSIYLEVVNAKNVYSFADFTTNTNLVLMNDITWSNVNNDTRTFTNNFIYGNGYKIDATQIGKMTGPSGLINLSGSKIDNIVILGKNYPDIVYYSSDPEDYSNSLIAVDESFELTEISNAFLSGMRAPLLISSDVNVTNTTIYGGVYANINVKNVCDIVLSNVNTIQEIISVQKNDGTYKDVIGAGIVYEAIASDGASLTLEGNFTQYNWINKNQLEDVYDASGITITQIDVKSLLNEGWDDEQIVPLKHTVNDVQYINMGIAFLSNIPESFRFVDNRVNKDLSFKDAVITKNILGNTFTGGLISYSSNNSSHLIVANQLEPLFRPANLPTLTQGILKPNLMVFVDESGNSDMNYIRFDDEKNEIVIGIKYNSGNQVFDFSEYFSAYKYGKELVVNIDVNGISNSVVSISSTSRQEYQLDVIVSDNYIYNQNGELMDRVDYVHKYKVRVELTSIPAPIININSLVAGDNYLFEVLDDNLFDWDYSPTLKITNLFIVSEGDNTIFNSSNLNGEASLVTTEYTISIEACNASGTPIAGYSLKSHNNELYIYQTRYDNYPCGLGEKVKGSKTYYFKVTFTGGLSGQKVEQIVDVTFDRGVKGLFGRENLGGTFANRSNDGGTPAKNVW